MRLPGAGIVKQHAQQHVECNAGCPHGSAALPPHHGLREILQFFCHLMRGVLPGLIKQPPGDHAGAQPALHVRMVRCRSLRPRCMGYVLCDREVTPRFHLCDDAAVAVSSAATARAGTCRCPSDAVAMGDRACFPPAQATESDRCVARGDCEVISRSSRMM